MTEVIDNTQTTALPPTPPPQDTNANKAYGKSFSNLPIAEQLLIGQRAYTNTSGNPQIGDVMIRYGYDRAKMDIFRNLLSEAEEANVLQTREYGDRIEAYTDFNKYFDIIKSEYSNMRKFLRIACKRDKDKLVKLQVAEAKKQTIGGLLEQINICYQNVLADSEVLQQLSKIGISELDVVAYKNNYGTTSHLYDIYFKENSEAADATRIRDEKMEALNDFLSDFFILARIAFASKPDLLKQIT